MNRIPPENIAMMIPHLIEKLRFSEDEAELRREYPYWFTGLDALVVGDEGFEENRKWDQKTAEDMFEDFQVWRC